MSQIDEKEFKLGQQLAISQLQSISDRLSVYQQPHPSFEILLRPSAHLHKSTFTINNRLSENAYNKRPHPVFVESASRGSYNHNESSPISARDRKVELQKINESEVFQCKCCRNLNEHCLFCLNSKAIKGNSNIIKFFEYVIAFKVGISPSYGQKKLNATTNRAVNQFCSEFFSNRMSTQSQYNPRESSSRADANERMSTRSKKCAKSQFANELNTLVTVHQNYCCDRCQTSPIIGNRYHCTECEDYDECEHCHTSSDHRHLMERVDRCGRGKQLESMVHILAQPVGKKSLRPPPSIKKQSDMSSITTRSALR